MNGRTNQGGKQEWNLIVVALVTLVLLLALLSLGRMSAQAETNTTQLRFEPASVDLTTGSPVTVTIQVADVEKLFGLEFDILYDPERVSIESIAPGDFLSADFVVKRTIDPARGIASLAYTQLAKEPRDGSGSVAVIVLRQTDCLYSTTLQLRNSILSNNDGVAIPHDTMDAIVKNSDTGAPRQLAGSIFHDNNANGIQDNGEQPLDAWPVFAQSSSSNAPQEIILSGTNGHFQFDSLACGRHSVWSQNGSMPTPVQHISLSAASDVLSVTIPITGSLSYPLQRVFIPIIERALP